MKNYEEVTKNVFRKSEELIARNERRRNTIMTIGASACCLAAVCGVGTIAWNRARSTVPVESAAQFVSGEYANASGASDTVVPENPAASGDAVVIWYPPLMPPDSDTSTPIHLTTTISGFEVKDTDTVKIAPDNGQIHISEALSAAMEQYGNVDENGKEIVYRVVIGYLQDRQTIPATYELFEIESARLKEQIGFGLGFETFSSNWGAHSEHWIHADFTKSQIESFTADPNYGYVLELYDNYHGYPITDPNSEMMTFDTNDTTIIRGFEVEDSEEKIAPDNGQIHISKALNAAMEHYGDVDENGRDNIYYVVITYFQDRHTILSTEEHYERELERFKEQLAPSLIDSFAPVCGPNHEQTIFAHLTKSEIKRFTVDPSYGYAIELYEENDRVSPITDHPDSEPVVFNDGCFGTE